MSDTRDAGYDDFLDAAEAGEPYYLAGDGEEWLPPRTVDPATAEGDLEEHELSMPGEILTYTVVNVAGPSFADDTPYVVAVAEFGPVNITGQVRGLDHDEVDIGQKVTLDVGRNETADERVIIFEPA